MDVRRLWLQLHRFFQFTLGIGHISFSNSETRPSQVISSVIAWWYFSQLFLHLFKFLLGQSRIHENKERFLLSWRSLENRHRLFFCRSNLPQRGKNHG